MKVGKVGFRWGPGARVVAVVVVVTICGLFVASGRKRGAAHASKAPAASTGTHSRLIRCDGQEGLEMDAESLRLAGISTYTAGTQDLENKLQLTGEVAPLDSATVQITSRLPGKVAEALVGVGDRVRTGQLIATVDSTDLAQAEAAYQTALSHAQLASHQLEQQRRLVQYGALNEPALEDAKNAFASAQGDLAQANITVHGARATFDRAKLLYKAGIYSKQQLEDAETSYQVAAAAVNQKTAQQELARKQLARAEKVHTSGILNAQAVQQAADASQEAGVALRGAEDTLRLYGVSPQRALAQLHSGAVTVPVVSPLAGIVTARTMVVGQMIDTSTSLAKVVNLDRVLVKAQVYEKDLAEIALGSPVRVEVSSFPERPFIGTVSYIGNAVDPDTRTLSIRILLPNPGWLLRPGMFATVYVQGRARQVGAAVPTDALLQEGSHQVAYVQVAPGRFVKRTVQVGAPVGGLVPVYGGLEPGDEVVVKNNVLLEREQQILESEK